VSTRFINLLGSFQHPDTDGTVGREPAWPTPRWLPDSWEKPAEFFSSLLQESEFVFGAPAKSHLEVGIDWYTDAVTRHLSRSARSPVMRSYDLAQGWQSLSLGALDAQAGTLAALLATRGAVPGDHIALVLPSGPLLAVALLATLRLGGCAVLVLPLGSAYVSTLLAASKPQWVISSAPYTALRGLMAYKPLLLHPNVLAGAAEPPPSATYAPADHLLLVPSPLRPEGELTPVSAADAYAGALRDGLLILGLRPGESLLAPPTPAHLPMTLLTALLCGACLVDLTPEAVGADAAALLRGPARAVLLPARLRDALASANAGPARWGRWFRDPQEPFDPAASELAEQRLRLSEMLHGNLVWDAAAGGAVLASSPRRGRIHPYVAPVPGCRYKLVEPGGTGPAHAAVGQFMLLGAKEEPAGSPGAALLGRTGSSYMYAGMATPRRAGWAYPAASALAILVEAREALGIVDAAVVEVASGGALGQALFVLVLFTGAAPVASCRLQACLELIDRELGAAAYADRAEVFALHPRRLGGDPSGPLDAAWVRAQYLSGELHRKGRTPLYRELTRARDVVLSYCMQGVA